jgi:hypothetical protein
LSDLTILKDNLHIYFFETITHTFKMKKTDFFSKSKHGFTMIMAVGVMGLYAQQMNAQTAKPVVAAKTVQTDTDEEDGERSDRSMNCGGVERWSVKVLVDNAVNQINFTPVTQTVSQLVALTTPSPSSSMPRTGPVEMQVYTTNCTITIKKSETDNDYHLVMTDGTKTMIGEIPDPACSAAASSAYVSQFTACRNFIDAHIASGNVYSVNIPPVVITGVGFVDPPHGQTGAAANNLEIHPILDIHFQSATGIIDPYRTLNVSVGPNPFISTTQFKVSAPLNNLGTCSLVLFDVMGRQVKEMPVPVTDHNTIDYTLVRGDLVAGIYMYRLKNDGAPLYEGKIVVQ